MDIEAAAMVAWHKQMGFTYESAAKALGISRATYARYLKEGAPHAIGLACAAIYAGLAPWGSKIPSKKTVNK